MSDLLGKADGVLAFREVLGSSPALRALMSEMEGAGGDPMAVDESNFRLVGGKLGENHDNTTVQVKVVCSGKTRAGFRAPPLTFQAARRGRS